MNGSLVTGDGRPQWRLPIVGIGLAAALGLLAYLLTLGWPVLFPQPVFVAAAPTGCDLHAGACTAGFDGDRFIRLEMEPKTLSPAEVLRILVDTGGFRVNEASIKFSGLDMSMGLIEDTLTANGAGSFTGNTVLPVCVRRQMTWRAVVTARGPDGTHQASFDFETSRR